MSEIINPKYFKPVLDLNEENAERIDKLCSPLYDAFGIKYFGFLRSLNDGYYLLVTNCPQLIKYGCMYDYQYRSEYFKNQPQFLCKYKTNKMLWPANTQDESIEGLRNENVHNGFTLIKEDKGTQTGYVFGTNSENDRLNDFYITHSSILENFIAYFHKLCGDLVDNNDVSKLGISPNMRKLYPRIEKVFLATTPWERKVESFNQLLISRLSEEIEEKRKEYSLTERELQCLSHLSTGKSAKEIAVLLKIGHRTVETYLESLRFKTQSKTKGELIHWFEMNFATLLNQESKVIL